MSQEKKTALKEFAVIFIVFMAAFALVVGVSFAFKGFISRIEQNNIVFVNTSAVKV